jgi:hypothetical protein
MALRSILGLQSLMATLFSSLEKGLVVFAHTAQRDWQMRSGFFNYFRRQDRIVLPKMVKFHLLYPNIQENQIKLSPGS